MLLRHRHHANNLRFPSSQFAHHRSTLAVLGGQIRIDLRRFLARQNKRDTTRETAIIRGRRRSNLESAVVMQRECPPSLDTVPRTAWLISSARALEEAVKSLQGQA